MWKTSKRAKVVAGLMATPVILWFVSIIFVAVLFGGSPLDNNPFDDLPFNRVSWMEDATVSDGSNRRGHMAQDIIKQLKVGTVKQAIYKMLGAGQELALASAVAEDCYPSAVYAASASSHHPDVAKVLRYYLGEELAMTWNIDHAALFLYFDAQDRYVGYEIGW